MNVQLTDKLYQQKYIERALIDSAGSIFIFTREWFYCPSDMVRYLNFHVNARARALQIRSMRLF